LEQVEKIWTSPLFDKHPVLDADHIQQAYVHLLACGWDTPERAPVCSTHPRTEGDQVAFDNYFFQSEFGVGERCAKVGEKLLLAIAGQGIDASTQVSPIGRRQKTIDRRDVPLRPNLIDVPIQ